MAHPRVEIFAATSKFKIPCAPVRDLEEVMHDPHMFGRGMLEVVDHYDYGPVVLPNSPLRFHGADKVPTRVSPRVGEHNDEIYGDWLGLSADERHRLRDAGVI
jgi:crotonobetainyl-CoA:carnitine CoA-transferase CaiB-like acyl-CoA transferase